MAGFETATMTRRGFLRSAALGGVAASVAACAPSAVAPAAPPAAPAGAPAAQEEWQRQWDQVVAAAKKEGKLVLLTVEGSGYRKAAEVFSQAFGIEVELAGGNSASVWVPKVQKERSAGVYTLDVAVVPPNSAINVLRPEGAWDPVRPVIFRPDVLDPKVWIDSFEERWMDKDKQIAFGWEFKAIHSLLADTTLVKPDAIKTAKDLLDPQWKGKIIMADVRIGGTFIPLYNVRKQYGDAFLKQFIVDQQPVFSRDLRAVAEGVVRKKYPLAFYVEPPILQEFVDQGLTQHLKYLEVPDVDYATSYCVMLFNRAPHSNAAKLFINWLLTKEGQTVFGQNVPTNSARKDVEKFSKTGIATPGVAYFNPNREEAYTPINDTLKYLTSLVTQ